MTGAPSSGSKVWGVEFREHPGRSHLTTGIENLERERTQGLERSVARERGNLRPALYRLETRAVHFHSIPRSHRKYECPTPLESRHESKDSFPNFSLEKNIESSAAHGRSAVHARSVSKRTRDLGDLSAAVRTNAGILRTWMTWVAAGRNVSPTIQFVSQ